MPAAASQKFIDTASSSTVSDFGKHQQPPQRQPSPPSNKHPNKKLQENDQDSPLIQFTPFTIRLHLIRHGETLANERNIVLGQGDSPLTDKGLALAGTSAKSGYLNGRTSDMRYWRVYTSDLYRAHRTAKIVLGLEDVHGNTKDVDDEEEEVVESVQQTTSSSDDEVAEDIHNKNNNIDLIVDPRLRELAKGPREGYLKTLSFEEAMSRRLQEAVKDNRYQLEQKLQVPKLESISDAWGRATGWIESLVMDAAKDYYQSTVSCRKDRDNNNSGNGNDASCNIDVTDRDDDEPKEKIYNVFALSHSALIRTMIHKMVDPQLPKNYALTNEGSLLLPNLSRTVIDVRPYYSKLKKTKSGRRSGSFERQNGDDDDEANDDGNTLRWKYRLVHLADVSHLSDDPSINTKRPPYLWEELMKGSFYHQIRLNEGASSIATA